jgi:hypothetical protein
MHGVDEKFVQNFICKRMKGGDNFGHLAVDGRVILKWILNRM